MRVLHVIASGARRGAEVFASDLIRALDSSGVEQYVAVLHGPEPVALDLAAPSTVLLPDTSDQQGRFDLRLRRALRAVAGDFRPDVTQAHGGEALKYLATMRAGPIVYRRIGSGIGRSVLAGPRRWAFTAQLRRAKRVIAVADSVRAETIEVFGIPAWKVVTIGNAVDPRRLVPTAERSSFRRSIGVTADALVVTFLGAFTWEKDPAAALRVAARAMQQMPSAFFVMAGDGPLRREVETAALSVDAERVKVLGSRGDVADILAASDVLLSSSRTEGMPANIIEAGLLGLPVVSYSIAGIPEIVVDGTTGRLAAAGDEQALAARLIEVLSDEDGRRAMGNAAREHCTGSFAIEPVAARYLAAYEEVVG
jgi:glycosyltransferase involved in cell wall biosynthesis